jgi:hypothetical protein
MREDRHRQEKTAGAMTVARSGKSKSDDCIVRASRYKINSKAAVIDNPIDDGHAQRHAHTI